ncbi:single-stranded DNA-binding protein [Muribaculaceae bacterium Isolate-013 (NCI)]|nr:single-stranded DNA-binding protein [Muribaculaceae bacterium Isolate-013 (NCI)]
MASINQATVIGFVGDDPKIMQTKNNKAMATFSIATTERGYTKQDGTSVEDITDWHNIVFFGKPAEVIQRFVKKGASLYVQGKMRTRSYVDKDNITRYVTEIIGDNFQLLDKRSNESTQQVPQSTVNAYPIPDDNMPPF